eukprot:COSAG02_NODE_7201_length_3122_cov_3.639762_2_plen_105_part_00
MTLAQATRAAERALYRSQRSTTGGARGDGMGQSVKYNTEVPSDTYQSMLEVAMLSKPGRGIHITTFAHDGTGAKRLLRERLQKKLCERDTVSHGDDDISVTPQQ